MFNREQASYKVLRGFFSERTRPIVAWVGAGMSAAAGLPVWKDLVSVLHAAASQKLASLGDDAGSALAAKLGACNEKSNPWDQMQILREGLGESSYTSVIKNALAKADSIDPPGNYHRLWRLGIRGLLNLNLDRLATRAFTKCFPERVFVEFPGVNAGKYMDVLQGIKPFVVNLHGDKENVSSWVLTSRDLDSLLKSNGYQAFVRACITQYSIVFVGISAEDTAVARHFEVLRREGLAGGEHFWVTDKRSQEADAWAESMGIQPIFYNSAGGSHDELDQIIQDLESFTPTEQLAPPAFEGRVGDSSSTETPGVDLKNLGTEELRLALNREAEKILMPCTPTAYESYERFAAQNEELIHRACFVPARPRSYSLLGYELLEAVGEGAFGSVYRARDSKGQEVAVKVLHDKVRRSTEMLQSFRRGVRSMRILAHHEVSGMVPYRMASEIPPFVVMDFVDGWNLERAVQARFLDNWREILRVARQLSGIIRKAHSLPERVLHRDLRPPNIMLQGFMQGSEPWRVVVLDFDLSWHLDAMEISITTAHSATGYLAPEQLVDVPGVSRRNAAVDSFGLGMTMFFVLSRRSPRLGEQSQSDWRNTLGQLARHRACSEWWSLPRRFCRLIEQATKDKQSERPDMHQIAAEISRLELAAERPRDVVAADLIAEEVLCHLASDADYIWEDDRSRGKFGLANGAEFKVSADEASRTIRLAIEWQSSGQESRKNIVKYLPRVESQATAALKKAGWKVVSNAGTRRNGVAISAECSSGGVLENLGQIRVVGREVVSLFAF